MPRASQGGNEFPHKIKLLLDFRAQNTASGFGDQDVIFDAYAAKPAVFLDFVVADEIFEAAFGFPAVDEGVDEVAAGLDGDDESRFECAGKSKCVEAKLRASASAWGIANIIAEVFHVVDVEAKHVSDAVRQEEGVCAFAKRRFDVAAHQPEPLECRGEGTAGFLVHVQLRGPVLGSFGNGRELRR